MDALRDVFTEEARELLAVLATGLMRLEQEDCDLEQVHDVFSAAHTLKGSARMAGAMALGDAAHAFEERLDALRSGERAPEKALIDELLGELDGLERRLDAWLSETADESGPAPAASAPARAPRGAASRTGAAAGGPARASVAHDPKPPGARARVSVDALRELGRTSGELLDLIRRSKRWDPVQRRLGKVLKRLEGLAAAEGALRGIDAGELRTLHEFVTAELAPTLGRLAPLGERTHELTVGLRRTQVASVAHRFERVVRDAASTLDRPVHFELQGRDVELDRVALQELVEPVSHLLRNAVTHGVESEREREAAGKPAVGQVTLRFDRNLDSVRVVVEDDGRGLDAGALREAAGADPDSAVEELAFQPGVSTSEAASPLAGRGVGLDSVARGIRRLGGSVRLADSRRPGCRFEIEVPSDLDMIETFVVDVCGQQLLLPLDPVGRVLRVAPEEVVEHGGGLAIVVDRSTLPLWDLAAVFGESRPPPEARFSLLLVRAPGGTLGLRADRLHGKRRVAVRPLPPALARVELLAGAAVQEDGRPGFLLALDALARVDLAFAPVRRAAATPPPRVLIVDDSLTSRVLARSLLEAQGFQVHTASSGPEALEALSEQPCDAAVLDFEMPGMDGLSLARRIRELPEGRDLPMLMLTSRADPEDKRRGLEAGMRAYLVKGAFDQREFVARVRGLVGESGDQSP